jgi:predicted MFS family arabinose efflux permease
VIPKIAADLQVDLNSAALLSTAYTLPYALVQPILGTFSDFFGKTRLMNVSLFVVGLAALVCAIATSFHLLIAMRIVAGLVAGGVFPVAMALVGDLVPVQQRQVAIGRLLAIGLIVAITAFFAFRSIAPAKPALPFNRAAVIAGFRGIFADPRAKVCFSAVFCEAVFIHGLFPFIAILLLAAGETRSAIAGLVIASFGMGGILYSLLVSVLVARISDRRLMISGGTLAALGLALTALHFVWYAQIGIFFMMGFGFYLLHASIQVHVTELSQTARGSATSLHSCFFYLGQAVGPVIYGFGFAHGGPEPSLLVGAVVVMLVGLVCSQLLRHRTASH